MDAKNVTQWAATIHPTSAASATPRHVHACQRLAIHKNNAVVAPPRVTLQNTNGSASMLISLPRIPVNPKITTTP